MKKSYTYESGTSLEWLYTLTAAAAAAAAAAIDDDDDDLLAI